MKHTYSITGMTCNSCKSKVESTLNTIDGVMNASVDLSQGKAIIEMANPIALDQLQNVLPDQYSILPDDEIQNIYVSLNNTLITRFLK